MSNYQDELLHVPAAEVRRGDDLMKTRGGERGNFCGSATVTFVSVEGASVFIQAGLLQGSEYEYRAEELVYITRETGPSFS